MSWPDLGDKGPDLPKSLVPPGMQEVTAAPHPGGIFAVAACRISTGIKYDSPGSFPDSGQTRSRGQEWDVPAIKSSMPLSESTRSGSLWLTIYNEVP